MKKILLASFISLGLISASVMPVQAGNGCFSLDGRVSTAMTDNFGHKYGLGGSMILEWMPIDFFSIGVGGDLLGYFGIKTPGITTLESVNLMTRIIFNYGDPFTVYLTGGGGINPKLDLGTDLQWGGDYHLMGGLGTWAFISDMAAFDIAVIYDFYNQSLLPPTDSMQALNLRVGLSFFFENAQKKGEAKTETASVVQPAPTQVVSETTPVPTTEVTASSTLETPVTQAAAPAVETPAPATEAAAPATETTAPAAETAAAPATQAAPPAAPKEGEIEVLKKGTADVAAEGPVTKYSVLKGDCLWVISGKDSIYGDSFKWPLLFQANRDQIADPDLIYPKQDFSIRRDFSQEEADKARQKASDTPKYVPHTKPRESLPVDYF